MTRNHFSFSKLSRRDLLRAGMYGVGVTAGALPLPLFAQAGAALAAQGKHDGKILVVLELSGGNDGLNTLVPYGDDAYYKHRPHIGVAKKELRPIDDYFGFSGGMAGFERLYKDGKLAIVHGCGYENPSFSHFTSMAYWHTAAPNSGEEYGWVGRLADSMAPDAPPNFLVNIAARQSLAVRSRRHVPVVFDDPNKFTQEKFYEEREILEASSSNKPASKPVDNPSRRFLLDTAQSAKDASVLVREAWAKYQSPVDYGITGLDLPKVASLIAAGMPTRLYYTSYRNNAFDTHVYQNDTHKRLLTYASDAVSAFLRDLERIGRADDVVVMIFSEFGRRVPENVNLGTDHGAANLMFVAGKDVKGGQYGAVPSLTKLDPGGNLIHTTDFRRVYATMIDGWLGLHDTRQLLNGDFETFKMFQG
ncbi:MAG: DUF1501 domain-containing protein [Acidobacteriia bacterium]|nr:DUF1501 domain-containing protein [Terriglobia bacterium]